MSASRTMLRRCSPTGVPLSYLWPSHMLSIRVSRLWRGRSATWYATHPRALPIYRSAPGDRIAQAYVSDPITWQGRKFDLRLYVAVRSLRPLRAWLYKGWCAEHSLLPCCRESCMHATEAPAQP